MSGSMTASGRRSERLSDVARHLVLPSGLVSTEWPAIRERARLMGVRFDQWQADLVRGALGKRADGKYAATVGGVVWSLPRQVGKTFTVGALLFAYAIENPGSLILWTAHHTRTSGETFGSMQGMAGRRRVAPYVDRVYTGSGTESVVFKNGSRILFGARDQGFGLGFAAVDVIVFDEAQRLRDRTRMDMVPATNRSHNPAGALLFYIGTPPRPDDDGDAFAALRADALGGDDDVFYVELSADRDADPDDQGQWERANPSFPTHTPIESMLRMRKHLGSDEAWLREALGIWDAVDTGGVIPAQAWGDAEDVGSVAVGDFALGVEVGPDLAWASVALAGRRPDGRWHLELDEDRHTMGAGVSWLAPHVEALCEANPEFRAVVADVGGPIAPLLVERGGRYWLRRADGSQGVEVVPLKVRELGAGCASLLSSVVVGDVRHIGQPQLSSAALSASSRPLGDTGMWVWSRKAAESDITPVQACTYALIGAQMTRPKRPTRAGARGSSGGRKAVVLG